MLHSHSKGLYTLDILTHNIAIKKYCDKKIFLDHGCQQAKVSSYQIIIQGKQGSNKSLAWLVNRNLLLKNVNVAISFYRNIANKNVQCVTALKKHCFKLLLFNFLAPLGIFFGSKFSLPLTYLCQRYAYFMFVCVCENEKVCE